MTSWTCTLEMTVNLTFCIFYHKRPKGVMEKSKLNCPVLFQDRRVLSPTPGVALNVGNTDPGDESLPESEAFPGAPGKGSPLPLYGRFCRCPDERRADVPPLSGASPLTGSSDAHGQESGRARTQPRKAAQSPLLTRTSAVAEISLFCKPTVFR